MKSIDFESFTFAVTALVAILAFCGCQSSVGSNSRGPDGYCTQSFISDYSKMARLLESVASLEEEDSAEPAKTPLRSLKVEESCYDFFNYHGRVRCKTYQGDNLEWFSSQRFESLCESPLLHSE